MNIQLLLNYWIRDVTLPLPCAVVLEERVDIGFRAFGARHCPSSQCSDLDDVDSAPVLTGRQGAVPDMGVDLKLTGATTSGKHSRQAFV